VETHGKLRTISAPAMPRVSKFSFDPFLGADLGGTSDKYSDSDIVELLIAHKADVNAADKQGLTPLHYALLADN
jgi:ankyrin repeat protein